MTIEEAQDRISNHILPQIGLRKNEEALIMAARALEAVRLIRANTYLIDKLTRIKGDIKDDKRNK